MAYVICDPCAAAMKKACVEVCPVDCIAEGPKKLHINPEECTECSACEAACPVGAIFHASEVPEKWRPCIAENAAFFKP